MCCHLSICRCERRLGQHARWRERHGPKLLWAVVSWVLWNLGSAFCLFSFFFLLSLRIGSSSSLCWFLQVCYVSSSLAAFVFLVSSPQAALTAARALEQLPGGWQPARWQSREASQVYTVPGRMKALWSSWIVFWDALERTEEWRICSKMIKKKKKIRPSPTFRISHWLFMSQMSFQYVNRPFMSKETNRKKGGEKRGREKGREEGREKEGKKNKAVVFPLQFFPSSLPLFLLPSLSSFFPPSIPSFIPPFFQNNKYHKLAKLFFN